MAEVCMNHRNDFLIIIRKFEKNFYKDKDKNKIYTGKKYKILFVFFCKNKLRKTKSQLEYYSENKYSQDYTGSH